MMRILTNIWGDGEVAFALIVITSKMAKNWLENSCPRL